MLTFGAFPLVTTGNDHQKCLLFILLALPFLPSYLIGKPAIPEAQGPHVQ